MRRDSITLDEVEQEISELQKSYYVKLALHERNLKNRRRNYLQQLRAQEKRGRQLAEDGLDWETLDAMYSIEE